MTAAEQISIDVTGIIPNHLLAEYLAGKNLVKPPRTAEEDASDDATYKTMYDNYKANMLKAQKAANEQLQGRRK